MLRILYTRLSDHVDQKCIFFHMYACDNDMFNTQIVPNVLKQNVSPYVHAGGSLWATG